MIKIFKLDSEVREDIYEMCARVIGQMGYFSIVSEADNEDTNENLLSVYKVDFPHLKVNFFCIGNFILIMSQSSLNMHVIETDSNDEIIYLYNLSTTDLRVKATVDNLRNAFGMFWGDLNHNNIDKFLVPVGTTSDWLIETFEMCYGINNLDTEELIEDLKWIDIH